MLGRAGEVDPAHGRVLDELVADRPGLARRVRDDVQHARRQPGLGEDLAPEQAADDRRPLRRLEHDGVAERERRRDRARREDQRGVPGRDRADDADGPAHAHRERARDVGGDDLARSAAYATAGGLPEQARARSASGTCRSRRSRRSRARAAATTSSQAALEDVGRLQEDAAAARPAASATTRGTPRLRRRSPRAASARGAGGHARDDVAGERILVVEGRAVRRRPPIRPPMNCWARGPRWSSCVTSCSSPACPCAARAVDLSVLLRLRHAIALDDTPRGASGGEDLGFMTRETAVSSSGAGTAARRNVRP